jgi:hypothetical protein
MRSMKSILGSTWPTRPPTSAAGARCVPRRRRRLPAPPEALAEPTPARPSARGAGPAGVLRRRRSGARRAGAGGAGAAARQVGFATSLPVRADRRRAGLRAHASTPSRSCWWPTSAAAPRTSRSCASGPQARRRLDARTTSWPTTACTSPAPTSTATSSWPTSCRAAATAASARRSGARGAQRRLLRPRHLAPDQHRLRRRRASPSCADARLLCRAAPPRAADDVLTSASATTDRRAEARRSRWPTAARRASTCRIEAGSGARPDTRRRRCRRSRPIIERIAGRRRRDGGPGRARRRAWTRCTSPAARPACGCWPSASRRASRRHGRARRPLRQRRAGVGCARTAGVWLSRRPDRRISRAQDSAAPA